ncbi:MAG: hypothetical protein RLZZ381_1810 [Cyanobacteriota bacterium]|jgi:hypothetical protein
MANLKGGHNTGKSPSNKETHQKGEARRQQDQTINPQWKAYKKKGKLSMDAWKKQGMPTKDK